MMKTGKQRFVILLLSVGLMLSGCSGKSAQEQVESGQATEAAHEHGHQTQLSNGDIQEATASIDELPAF